MQRSNKAFGQVQKVSPSSPHSTQVFDQALVIPKVTKEFEKKTSNVKESKVKSHKSRESHRPSSKASNKSSHDSIEKLYDVVVEGKESVKESNRLNEPSSNRKVSE